jgi:hypothetical protein
MAEKSSAAMGAKSDFEIIRVLRRVKGCTHINICAMTNHRFDFDQAHAICGEVAGTNSE